MTDTSGKTKGFKDGTNQTTEYFYDDNGNMIEDKNKGITSIEYNYLNLPKKVTFSASKYIEYTYDASGAKLSRKTVDGGTTKVSDYLGGFVYEDDKLQFLQHDEGRVVAKRDESGNFDGFEYQYHLKDHLGNPPRRASVRTTFKTEQEIDNYLATFEDDAATKNYESTYFSRYGEVTRINADIFDHTDAGISKTYSSRLNGTGNEIYGLAKSLEVKPGDKVSAEVYAKYLDPSTTGTSGSAFAQLIEDLSNNASTVVVDGATAGTDPIAPPAGLMDHSTDNSNGPKAYLNIVVIDKEGNVEDISYAPVTSVAKEDGTDVPHQYLKTGTITVKEPGLAYIYLSNETGSRIEVFFDDFLVTHENTEIVQKDDYYPFGLSFNSYTRPESVDQKFKFNGKERQELTGWDDFGARMYMSDLGRWGVVDKKSDDIMQIDKSPYQYAWDNPVNLTDPDGNCPWCLGAAVGGLVEYGSQVAVNLAQGQSLTDATYNNVDFVDVGVATVEGGITGGASVAKNLVKKTVVVGVSEIAKAAVDGTKAGGITVETDVSKVATDAAIGTAFAVGSSETGKALVNASSDAAVKSAKSGVNAANKNLNKAVKSVQNGDVRSKAALPKVATDNLTGAKTNLATAKALNGTIGANKATQETTKAAVDGVGSLSGVGATDTKDEIVY